VDGVSRSLYRPQVSCSAKRIQCVGAHVLDQIHELQSVPPNSSWFTTAFLLDQYRAIRSTSAFRLAVCER